MKKVEILLVSTTSLFNKTKTSAGDVNCHCLSFLQIDHVDPTLSPEVYLLHPSRKLLAQAVSWPPVSPLRIRFRVCPPRTSIAAHLSGALLEATASLGARTSLPGFTFGSIGRAMLKGKKNTTNFRFVDASG